jgi:hypothetical protein
VRKLSSLNRLIRIAVPALVVVLLSFAAPGTAGASDASLRDRNTLGPTTADIGLTFGRWTLFNFAGNGSFNVEGAFTFSSPHPVLLRVTDGLCRGDRFRVWDRGSPIFLSSTVATDPSCDDIPFVTGPARAWEDQTYSKGRFLLQPGWHRIRIQAVNSPFGGGSGWLQAIQQPVG